MDRFRASGSDKVRAYDWFDLAASYTFSSGIQLALGINNILDEEPPLMPDLNGYFEVNLYGNYDPLGRYIFTRLQFNF